MGKPDGKVVIVTGGTQGLVIQGGHGLPSTVSLARFAPAEN